MPIDHARLAEFRESGAHWTAGTKLLNYLREEAGWDQSPEQSARDEVLVQWLSGELSHDETTRQLLRLAAATCGKPGSLTAEANLSLQGLLDPTWTVALRAKTRELQCLGFGCRPGPKLATHTVELTAE